MLSISYLCLDFHEGLAGSTIDITSRLSLSHIYIIEFLLREKMVLLYESNLARKEPVGAIFIN